jgi:hypothetical protein
VLLDAGALEGLAAAPASPVLHDAEALEGLPTVLTLEGALGPGDIGASGLRSSIHGGGRGL